MGKINTWWVSFFARKAEKIARKIKEHE